MHLSGLDLLRVQAEALFTHDDRGRIAYVNEPDGRRAPRFAFWMSSQRNLWRFREDLSEAAVEALDRLAAVEPVCGERHAAPRQLAAMLDVLRIGETDPDVYSGPAFHFPEQLPAAAEVVCISSENLGLLHRFDWDLEEEERHLADRAPVIALIRDGAAASVCFSSRLTDRAAEAGLETVEGYRGRGFALLVVAAWARAVRASGRIPLYSTSWENVRSQAVARKLGLVQYGTNLSIE